MFLKNYWAFYWSKIMLHVFRAATSVVLAMWVMLEMDTKDVSQGIFVMQVSVIATAMQLVSRMDLGAILVRYI